MSKSSAIEVVHAFIEAINRGDLIEVSMLLTDEHLFVDALGATVRGHDAMLQAWAGYFGIVPDYEITVDRTVAAGESVAVFGTARGTCRLGEAIRPDGRWETPAAWLAVVRDGKIAEWRVFTDGEPIRQILRRHEEDS
ncbi:MAG: nuclear transport factor 2 family protein [Planctomycetota bacterium]|jgi:ketosteroid isomerase-like protein